MIALNYFIELHSSSCSPLTCILTFNSSQLAAHHNIARICAPEFFLGSSYHIGVVSLLSLPPLPLLRSLPLSLSLSASLPPSLPPSLPLSLPPSLPTSLPLPLSLPPSLPPPPSLSPSLPPSLPHSLTHSLTHFIPPSHDRSQTPIHWTGLPLNSPAD